MNNEYILEVRHISKSFGKHLVLKDITFQIRREQIIGISGENGVGKSTLLKILSGFLPPTKGEFTAQGRIGFCPQELLIFETLTVKENFIYFATAYGLEQKKAATSWEKTKGELIEQFRFHCSEDTLASFLSGGTKQKLNLSLALLHSPDLFILDEPYSGFDWETYLHFWQYAEELKSRGKSFLVVSHFIHDHSKFDTIFQLKEGVLQCVSTI